MNDSMPTLDAARAYLSGTDKTVAVVFDAPSQAALHLLLPAARFPKCLLLCSIDAVADVVGAGMSVQEWLTFSVHDEPPLRRKLRSILAAAGCPQAVVRTLPADAGVPAGNAHGMGRKPAGAAAAAPPLAYAIVCTPRSGSTYLGQLLGSAGFGSPREHLRNAEVARIVDLKLDDATGKTRFIEYMHAHKRNDIFGTKVISQYLFTLLKQSPPPRTLRRYIRDNVSVVYLVRKDKVGQALSDFLARKSRIWHATDAQSSETMAEVHGKVEYSFEEILRRYTVAVNEDTRLVRFIGRMRHCVLFYEDISNDPDAAVAKVGRFLDRPVTRRLQAKVQKTEGATTRQFRERFNADYQAQFGHLPEEYVPAELLQAEPV